MDKTEACFFALLRAGLWNEPVDISFFSDTNTDWETIFCMAKEQAVAALVFDGMEMLPAELRPAKTLIMKWYAVVLRIEQSNKLLNRELAGSLTFYQNYQIYPVLLKGQGIAGLYPSPEHRQCGDIDFYVGNDYCKIKKLLLSHGFRLGDEGEKHVNYQSNGVEVEVHRYAACFYNPLQNRILQRWTSAWLSEEKEILHLQDVNVFLPAPGFNVIYLLVHSLLHFIPEGVGLRQICDWSIVLKTYSSKIDKERLVKEVHMLKLEEAFATFGYVAVNYLGLPKECIPFSMEEVKIAGEFLLKDIMEGGNFGKVRRQNRELSVGKWRKVWHNYKNIQARCRGMKCFCRAEARWYPYFRALNLVYKKLHGLD